jgi:eukaryotic-like serine/threonine-protein kinase
VDQLAEDVRRHLQGLPVLARNHTLGYRTSKFVRRHQEDGAHPALSKLVHDPVGADANVAHDGV